MFPVRIINGNTSSVNQWAKSLCALPWAWSRPSLQLYVFVAPLFQNFSCLQVSTSSISFINPILFVSYPILPPSSIKLTNSRRGFPEIGSMLWQSLVKQSKNPRLLEKKHMGNVHVCLAGAPVGLHASQTVVRTWHRFTIFHFAPFARLVGAGYQHFVHCCHSLRQQLWGSWGIVGTTFFPFSVVTSLTTSFVVSIKMTPRSVYHMANSKTCFVRTTLSVS